jgi:hypothetical protein
MDQAGSQLLASMAPLATAPTLRTVNGIGFRLSGSLSISGAPDRKISCYWFVLFFLPVIPVRLYVVSGPTNCQYTFYGSPSFGNVAKVYGNRGLWLYLSAWLEGGATLVAAAVVIALVVGLFSLFRHR